MPTSFFTDMLSQYFNPTAVLDISRGGKVLVISDFHMGCGGRGDDLAPNGPLLLALLEGYYLREGSGDTAWNLVLNGDIEELQRYPLGSIRKQWSGLYRLFDRFALEGRLYKILGNHDENLVFEKEYPYPLYNAIRIETGYNPIYVYHGHQSSRLYTDYKNIVGASIRYFLKPFGIRNISSARNPYRRFHV
jgi:metallophosphoesterase superfamily enzyme